MKTLLTALVAMAIGVFAVPVMAAETLHAEVNPFLFFVVEKITGNPTLSSALLCLSAAMPLIGFIANRTKNPIDNAVMIFINKVLQTLAFNTSKNQPDVLSWKQMLTSNPKDWSGMLMDKAVFEVDELKKRVLSKLL